MATLLLDSSVIFDTLNGKRGRRDYLNGLLAQGNLLACCPINITEIYTGLRDYEKEKTEEFINSLEFFPITREISQRAGLIRREWRQKGQTLSFTDASLAAVAIEHGLPFLTDNTKHFPMPELQLFPLP